jgi:hypothetical protein
LPALGKLVSMVLIAFGQRQKNNTFKSIAIFE